MICKECKQELEKLNSHNSNKEVYHCHTIGCDVTVEVTNDEKGESIVTYFKPEIFFDGHRQSTKIERTYKD